MADTCINIFDTIYLYFFSEAVDNIIELNFDDLVSIYFFPVQKYCIFISIATFKFLYSISPRINESHEVYYLCYIMFLRMDDQTDLKKNKIYVQQCDICCCCYLGRPG